jgi:hypothetical protein
MISIEDRKLFAKAEQKAREVKPRVWSLTFGSYMVEGHDKDYRVTFSKEAGHWYAECNCPAHTKSSTPRPCYHVPAAYVAMKIQIGIKQQVRAAEAAQVPSIADWTPGLEAA